MSTLCGPPLEEAEGIGALTLGGFLVETCSRFGDNEALVFDDPLRSGATVRWTYSALEHEARRVARALLAAGVGKGSRVGILMGNRPEAVAGLFGAALSGAVAVPLSTFSSRPELEYLLGHADISVLLTQTEMLKRDYVSDLLAICPEAGEHPATGTRPPRWEASGEPGSTPASDPAVSPDVAAPLRSVTFPFLETIAVVGLASTSGRMQAWQDFLDFGASIEDAILDGRAKAVDPSDLGLVIYSSGTTDQPKGMLHNHRATTLQFWLQARVFGRRPTTRLWTALPMFWTAGLNTALGPTLAGGGCWVMQESFEPGEALRLMARERVTEPYTLPHQTASLEEHPDWASTDLSGMRCVFGKSAFARHPSVTGDPQWNSPVAYGLSETCSGFISHYHDTPRELLRQSMGRLLPGNRLRIVDPDTGGVLGPNEDGELAIAGPTLMEHYVKKNRDECFDEDGFFHTGDVGFYDRDGFVHWTGRRTEMIKTAGANVSPAELEVQLRAFQPLKLARVLGVPDPRLGQVVVLAAVLKEDAETDAEEVRSFLRERVSSYKVPKHVLFFEDGEIPMTTSDTKVRDAELLKMVTERLAEGEKL